MASTNDLISHPRLTFAAAEAGKVTVSYDMKGWGEDITASYWEVEAGKGCDRWRYTLPMLSGKGGTFSHPTEHGCKIAIVRHLIEANLIETPDDNGHLDERNRAELALIESAHAAFTEGPRIGDFVIMPNGNLERCCNANSHGMQTTYGGSFSISKGGQASYSGSLNKSRLWEYFKDTGETKRGKFWFFSHGIAGAGRGVECYLTCRVYRLETFTMDEETARNHPMARRSGEFWGENSRDHLLTVQKLMDGEA